MPISGTVQQAQPGKGGFDCNQILTPSEAKAFKDAGMDFAVRYLPRGLGMGYAPITASEAQVILNAGLCLSLVQHVEAGEWYPTAALGTSYGNYAAKYANEIGLPKGLTLWLDLESVNTASTVEDVATYCNNWWQEVVNAGYTGGVYVGWHPGLNNEQLYEDLKAPYYWRSYNADNSPILRGCCMLQHPQKMLNGIAYDPNTTQLDQHGGIFTWLAP